MGRLDSQREYWDTAGTTKTFGYPIELGWLDQVPRDAPVLDYGCGYGRLTAELTGQGFTAVEGVDVSPALVGRARDEHPGLRFAVLDDPPRLPHPDGSFAAALLFAVLTCVPGDDAQRGLVAELSRVLRPGGLLYVSDLPLQDDERNRERYERFAGRHGTYGVFETDDGAVLRHHTGEWLRTLFEGFDTVRERELDARTMNGRPVRAVQLLLRTRVR
ncbi:class I SAM-dependent methyltransferase [Dactylosporangium sp. NPDC051485]|uniref:class I SAM-dependent methyltransferase n=1 Tax=Dactylosporangium sp. NPDC051485 TaxID=3154846 RepID=UPI00344705EE